MKCKKNGNKKELQRSIKSSKILKDIYDAKYDLSQLRIVTVDGVLPFIDSEEARLLFFHNIPSLSINNDRDEENLNKCLVEIRMTTPTLQMISEILNYELQCFKKNKDNDKNGNIENKYSEQYMFG